MLLVVIAWLYVVAMMSLAEAVSPQGTLLGAVFTFVGYGVLPLAIVLYVFGTPARRRARAPRASGPGDGDGRRHAAGDPVAPEREEP